MIQKGSYLNVIDNSGARKAICIQVLSGYRHRYAYIGNILIVSVRSLRAKRRVFSKVKKGSIYTALLVRTKKVKKFFSGDSTTFLENSIILLNKQKKLLGTRIFGALPKYFRNTKFLKILSLSFGNLL